jgi:YYY domain-containing protein
MDFAIINSILRSDYFPPADPWLAGESFSYYYGGHLSVSVLTLISRVPPSIAYNLATAVFFSLAICASFGLGYNITKRKLYGFVAVVFVCIAGYLSGAFKLSAHISGGEIMGYDPRLGIGFVDWLLSFDLGVQVIPGTCNLYPYYAFLQGDLHANIMSIPFQLMFITLVFALFKKSSSGMDSSKFDYLLNIIILGLSLGFFLFINAWDYPSYVAFVLLACIFLKIGLDKKGILVVIGLSLLLYVPYLISMGVDRANGVGLVDLRTNLMDFVEIFALFLFAIGSLFYVLSRGRLVKERILVMALALTIVTALLSYFWGFQLVLILMPLILASLYYIYKATIKGETEFILLLVLIGAVIALFCEVAFIDDSLSAPNERYNTVFKFYLQIWILLGLSSAYAVFMIMRGIKGTIKVLWLALLFILVFASIIHPVFSTIGWTSGKHTAFWANRGTLDGLEYIKKLYPGDYEGINWINENIDGYHIILEAPGGAYSYTSRVSTMTGLPTVIGWLTHEVIWRNSWDVVSGRDTDSDTIYQTTDEGEALALLRKYNVEYIFIGSVERERYQTEGLQKFANQPSNYELVYQGRDVEVYRVLP